MCLNLLKMKCFISGRTNSLPFFLEPEITKTKFGFGLVWFGLVWVLFWLPCLFIFICISNTKAN